MQVVEEGGAFFFPAPFPPFRTPSPPPPSLLPPRPHLLPPFEGLVTCCAERAAAAAAAAAAPSRQAPWARPRAGRSGCCSALCWAPRESAAGPVSEDAPQRAAGTQPGRQGAPRRGSPFCPPPHPLLGSSPLLSPLSLSLPTLVAPLSCQHRGSLVPGWSGVGGRTVGFGVS